LSEARIISSVIQYLTIPCDPIASDAAVRTTGGADGDRRMVEKMRLKAFGRKAGRLSGSCKPILVRED